MSREEIKAAETAELVKETRLGFIYKEKILGYPVSIFMDLGESGLEESRLEFENIGNPQKFIPVREELEAMLTEKYGDPLYSIPHWMGNTYAHNRDEHWKALLIGELEFRTEWNTSTTQILLLLGKHKDEIYFFIRYTPRNSELKKL